MGAECCGFRAVEVERGRKAGREREDGGGDLEGKLIKNSSDLSKVTPTPRNRAAGKCPAL